MCHQLESIGSSSSYTSVSLEYSNSYTTSVSGVSTTYKDSLSITAVEDYSGGACYEGTHMSEADIELISALFQIMGAIEELEKEGILSHCEAEKLTNTVIAVIELVLNFYENDGCSRNSFEEEMMLVILLLLDMLQKASERRKEEESDKLQLVAKMLSALLKGQQQDDQINTFVFLQTSV